MRMVLDEKTHTYRDLDDPERRYTSVSRVISWLGIKKSWEVLEDPDDAERRDRAVEFARERGLCLERIIYALLQGNTPDVEVPQWTSDYNGNETLAESVQRFLPGVYNWIDSDHKPYQHAQRIVADRDAGIAGTLDLRLTGQTVDIKCTSKEEADWKLQLGAYGTMTEPWQELAVLHINPKFQKGYMWREYDRDTCLSLWGEVRQAWMQSMEIARQARMSIETRLK